MEFLIFVIILLCAFLVYKYYKSKIEEKVRCRISCWLTDSGYDLLDYIQNKCIREIIEDRYLITGESEQKIAIEIIEAYREEMKYRYVKRHYTINRDFAKMSYPEYFMYYLNLYLDNYNTYYFKGNMMYIEQSKRHYYGGVYIRECTPTDYGMVYRKLYYMALLFCEKSAYLNKDHNYSSEEIKKTFDTKQVTLWY